MDAFAAWGAACCQPCPADGRRRQAEVQRRMELAVTVGTTWAAEGSRAWMGHEGRGRGVCAGGGSRCVPAGPAVTGRCGDSQMRCASDHRTCI